MVDATGRAQLRAVLFSILKCIPGAHVYSPGDWNQPTVDLPAIKLRQGKDRKTSLGTVGQTQFTTVATFEIHAQVSSKSAEGVLSKLETLGAEIEAAIFRSIPLRSLAEDFPFCETDTQVTAEGGPHIGALLISLGVQFPEAFAPDVHTELLEMTVDADLTNVADKLGTYPDSPFPVAPAPRIEGPDGRPEGGIDVTFSR